MVCHEMTSDKLENANIIACGIESNWRRIGFSLGVWDGTIWAGGKNKSGSLNQQHESLLENCKEWNNIK